MQDRTWRQEIKCKHPGPNVTVVKDRSAELLQTQCVLSLLSRKLSVKTITNPRFLDAVGNMAPNSLYDLALGPADNKEVSQRGCPVGQWWRAGPGVKTLSSYHLPNVCVITTCTETRPFCWFVYLSEVTNSSSRERENQELMVLFILSCCCFCSSRFVPPVVRTSGRVQVIWDTWSFLCPCTTHSSLMWVHPHTHTHTPVYRCWLYSTVVSRSFHQKLYLLIRGSCLACHMLTCPRASIHLLINQLLLLDHGAMQEVYQIDQVLNQVCLLFIREDRTVDLKTKTTSTLLYWNAVFQYLEGNPKASGDEIEEVLSEFTKATIGVTGEGPKVNKPVSTHSYTHTKRIT